MRKGPITPVGVLGEIMQANFIVSVLSVIFFTLYLFLDFYTSVTSFSSIALVFLGILVSTVGTHFNAQRIMNEIPQRGHYTLTPPNTEEDDEQVRTNYREGR